MEHSCKSTAAVHYNLQLLLLLLVPSLTHLTPPHIFGDNSKKKLAPPGGRRVIMTYGCNSTEPSFTTALSLSLSLLCIDPSKLQPCSDNTTLPTALRFAFLQTQHLFQTGQLHFLSFDLFDFECFRSKINFLEWFDHICNLRTFLADSLFCAKAECIGPRRGHVTIEQNSRKSPNGNFCKRYNLSRKA